VVEVAVLHGAIIHLGPFHRKEGETATAEEFIAYFRERLVAYKVPSEVEFRSDLPKIKSPMAFRYHHLRNARLTSVTTCCFTYPGSSLIATTKSTINETGTL